MYITLSPSPLPITLSSLIPQRFRPLFRHDIVQNHNPLPQMPIIEHMNNEGWGAPAIRRTRGLCPLDCVKPLCLGVFMKFRPAADWLAGLLTR